MGVLFSSTVKGGGLKDCAVQLQEGEEKQGEDFIDTCTQPHRCQGGDLICRSVRHVDGVSLHLVQITPLVCENFGRLSLLSQLCTRSAGSHAQRVCSGCFVIIKHFSYRPMRHQDLTYFLLRAVHVSMRRLERMI